MNLVGFLFLMFFCLSAAGRATKLHFRYHRSSSECYSQSLFYKAESYFLSKTAVWLWLKLYYLATHTVCSSLLITVVQADDFKCDIMQLYFLPLMQCLWITTTQCLWVCFIISSGDAKIIYGIPCQISKGFLICTAPFFFKGENLKPSKHFCRCLTYEPFPFFFFSIYILLKVLDAQ